MPPQNEENTSKEREMSNDLKNWVMIALTFIFVLLYVAALAGILKPLEKTDMLTRLEPIIFVIIGYYFGRLPAQQNEKNLKSEITRQTQKADAAQHAKEKALQEREALEEKIKNAKTALDASSAEPVFAGFAESSHKPLVRENESAWRNSFNVAKNILNS